jgi:hypothetical protein
VGRAHSAGDGNDYGCADHNYCSNNYDYNNSSQQNKTRGYLEALIWDRYEIFSELHSYE